MEIWKPLKNFPSYNGSSEGRIMNIKTQRILKTFMNYKGYVLVCLRKNNRQYTVRVAQVIAETFLGEHPGMDITYKNGNRSDIDISNLEWCTRSYNTKHSFELGLQKVERGEQRYNAVLNDELVREIRTLLKIQGISKTARDLGLKKSTVANVKYGAWKHIK